MVYAHSPWAIELLQLDEEADIGHPQLSERAEEGAFNRSGRGDAQLA